MAEVHLRDFDFEQDYDIVIQLWSRSGPGLTVGAADQPAELRKYLKRSPGLFIIAEQNGQIIGTLMGGYDGRRAMVYHLAVDERFRKQGIADQMIRELEKRFTERGCKRYYLFAKNFNHTAIQFYLNHGFDDLTDLRVFAKDLE